MLGFHLDLDEPWGRAPRSHRLSGLQFFSAAGGGTKPGAWGRSAGSSAWHLLVFPISDRALPVQMNPSTYEAPEPRSPPRAQGQEAQRGAARERGRGGDAAAGSGLALGTSTAPLCSSPNKYFAFFFFFGFALRLFLG